MKKLFVSIFLAWSAAAWANEPLLLRGAGATFPYPIYAKWFAEYNKLAPDVRFSYQPVGSGNGIVQFLAGTVDFGASDVPLNNAQIGKVPDVVHVPTVLGAVVLTYNVPVSRVRLTSRLVADIYLGNITRWNDPELVKVNPSLASLDMAITVVHRGDSSGTTFVFTNYLSKVSPEFRQKVGNSTTVGWPLGLSGSGNQGVAALVKDTPGAIGYIELAYADENRLPLTELKNKEGFFVRPTQRSTSEAAAGIEVPNDYRVSITDAAGKDAWPLASFTYLLIHRNPKDRKDGLALKKFLWWATHEGQSFAEALDYAPLPRSIVAKVSKTIESL